ncbi:MAG TPA: serine hydrolase domain-containing protein [Ilumatobacteraceae bacterium]|nr:serine hydrolase domain-containing protein [Ilumatobacteraceae bacterium]
MTALDLTAEWPVPHVSAAVLRAGRVVDSVGDDTRVQRLASISKPMATWAVLVAVEEGIVHLDQPVGQPGCTLRHLLAHAGGYPFEGNQPIAPPETTRMYSNSGFSLAAQSVEAAAGMPFADYLHEAVFAPLAMSASVLRGSAAKGVRSDLADTCRFVAEVMRPTLVHESTADDARRVHYPTLGGMVPDVGRYEQCPWGLGFEVRGDKQPHWTGMTNSPRTYGHFGGAGTMMWIDPDRDVALVALADRDFDEWSDTALRVWPELSDAVLAEYAGAADGGVTS